MERDYSIMRVEKIKSVTAFTRAENHNLRRREVPNADPSKQAENKILAGREGEGFSEAFGRIVRDECGEDYKIRKNAVLGVHMIFTFSHGAEKRIDMDKWENTTLRWIKDEFGEKNIISAVLHMDESTPHIHAIITPIVDGKLNGSRYFACPNSYERLRKSYSAEVEGLGLAKGRTFSKIPHTVIQDFYARLEEQTTREIPEVSKGERAEDYRARVIEILKNERLGMLAETVKKEKDLREAEARLKAAREKDEKTISARYRDLSAEEADIKHRKLLIEKNRDKINSYDDILFGLNHGYFSPESVDEIDGLSEWLKEHPRGETDIWEDDTENRPF